MKRRWLTILTAALSSFALTFGVLFVLQCPSDQECAGEQCALEQAAALLSSLVVAILIGAVAAFVAHAVLPRSGSEPF